MLRRGFLRALLAAAAAPAVVRASSLMRVAPSGLLVPESEIVTSNSLLTISDITNEALQMLERELTISNTVNVAYQTAFACKALSETVSVWTPRRLTSPPSSSRPAPPAP